jgi:hypothetical protein
MSADYLQSVHDFRSSRFGSSPRLANMRRVCISLVVGHSFFSFLKHCLMFQIYLYSSCTPRLQDYCNAAIDSISWEHLPPTIFNCLLQVMADQLAGLSDSVEAIGQSIENPAMLPIIIRAARRLQPQLHIRALKSLNYHLLSKYVLISGLVLMHSVPSLTVYFRFYSRIPVPLRCFLSHTQSQ